MSRYLGQGNGSDGVVALGSYTQTWYSCSGTSGSTSLTVTGTFSAGDRVFIHQSRGTGVGSYEDNTVASYVAGTLTLVHPLENTYTDSGASQAQVAVVKEASSVTGSFTVADWDGDVGGIFVIACNGTFSGTVDVTGKGFRASAVLTVSSQTGKQGEGTTGAGGTQTKSPNGSGGGGGEGYSGNSRAGGGGGGGYAADGTDGHIGQTGDLSTEGGEGGLEVGQADLTTGLFLGGAGGGGGSSTVGGGAETPGKGGDGGGIIVLYCNEIDSSSSLIVDGADGTAPSRDGLGGGGGGAGGTILIKGVSTNVSGTVTAAAGARGEGTGGGPIPGGAGSVGRIRIESCSITGTTSPTASESEGGQDWCGGAGAFIF